ncbi:uncharacterized protein N7479_009935 [Penicillium vulpinum]|uniref:Uncharacterized protein n=1 Tax=Penicillium vulpinum TaxID=29845 RepID=A0A1V6RXN2_9EURO|nr:uncharacterized protein N7479_009935 [Penicillium vulpinum]KAJ5951522.1 hypothetical protein N7479_009935 [Penicillium vulpinum]OQE06535.1 hypothetical protein PENVUL_c017G09550 [Penicillium vulpinum]
MTVRSQPLAGGIAFITGGARGLGNAVAVSFAKDGATGIALVDIQDEQTFLEGRTAVEKYNCKCITIRADVTKEEEVERAVRTAVAAFGRIDYAANFAGIAGPFGKTWETDYDAWNRPQQINAGGTFLCMKHQLKQMMKQDPIKGENGRVSQRGSIVNCASINSMLSVAGARSYTASKHAVVGMTKAAALEAREHGIRVNAVSPGFIMTQLLGNDLAAAVASGKIESPWKPQEERQGRKASPDEIGDVVVLLSTPRMSLVNGHNLVIDGGFSINGGNN